MAYCDNCDCADCKLSRLVAENGKLLETLAKTRDELRHRMEDIDKLREHISATGRVPHVSVVRQSKYINTSLFVTKVNVHADGGITVMVAGEE